MEILMAAVFVAGKVEECIRRARDIVNVFHHLYCLIRKLPSGPIEYVGDTYYIWRDRLCTAESLLLRELGFHVQPASPVNLLINYLKILELDQSPPVPQVALNFLNDALKTEAYIRFQPRIIAVAAVALSLDRLNLTSKLLPEPEALQAPWYTLFDVNETELVQCKQIIMTIYNRELDTLLPLTKEELTIFSTSIKPEIKEKEEDRHRVDNRLEHKDRNRDYKDNRDRRDDRSSFRDRRSNQLYRESSHDRYNETDRSNNRNYSHPHSRSHSNYNN